MKKSLTIFFSLVLMLINIQNAFGAVHDAQGDFIYYGHDAGMLVDNLTPPGTPWFSVANDSHYLKIEATQKDAGSLGLTSLYSIEEYQNDQMFGVLNYLSPANTYKYLGSFRCGYLFDNGLDLGMDYNLSADNSGLQQYSTLISLGYRYNFKNIGYAALSLDYLYEQNVKGVYGYDLDFKYFLNKMKINGQIYQPAELRTSLNNTLANLEVNYQLYNFLVLGGILNYQPVNAKNTLFYQAGFTLTEPFFIVNGKIGQGSDGVNFYKGNGSLVFSNNYSLGVEYSKNQNDTKPKLTYMINSDDNDLHLSLAYTPGVNGNNPNWSLMYKIDPFNNDEIEE